MIQRVHDTYVEAWENKLGVDMFPINNVKKQAGELMELEKARNKAQLIINASNFVGANGGDLNGMVTVDLICGVPPRNHPTYSSIPRELQSIAAALTARGYMSVAPMYSFAATLNEISFDIVNTRHVNSLGQIFDFGHEMNDSTTGHCTSACTCLIRLLCGQKNVGLHPNDENYLSPEDQVSNAENQTHGPRVWFFWCWCCWVL
jgi:hypothetical protein